MPNDMTPKRGYEFKSKREVDPARLDTELDRIFNAFAALNAFLAVAHEGSGDLKGSSVEKRNLRPGIFADTEKDILEKAQKILKNTEKNSKATQDFLTRALDVAKQCDDLAEESRKALSQSLSAIQIIETAQIDVNRGRGRAETAFSQASARAQDAQTSSASARIAEDMAYRWAEKLDGPVFVPENGDPVDDGFYSSKFWALQASNDADQIKDWYDQIEAWYLEIRDVFYPELLAIYQDFRSTYYPPSATDPTEDPFGDPPTQGDLYFNTSTNSMRVYDGTQWVTFEGEATFLGLNDTPQQYTGSSLFLTRVNAAEDALEFVDGDTLYVPKTAGDQHPFTGDIYINDESGDLSQIYFVDRVPAPGNTLGRLGSLQFSKINGVGAVTVIDPEDDGPNQVIQTFTFHRDHDTNAEPNRVMRFKDTQSKFVQKTGDVMTGPLSITTAGTTLNMLVIEPRTLDNIADIRVIDQAGVNDWKFRFQVNPTGVVQLRFNNAEIYKFRYDGAAIGANDVLKVGTGDARYLNYSTPNQTLTPAVYIGAPGHNVLRSFIIRARNSDEIGDLILQNNDAADGTPGAGNYAWTLRWQAKDTGQFSIRHNDVQKFVLTAGGGITIDGTMVAGAHIAYGEYQARPVKGTGGNSSMGFREEDGTIHYLLYREAASNSLLVNKYDDGLNGRVIALFPDRIANGGTLSQVYSAVTREHGDDRYTRFSDPYVPGNTYTKGQMVRDGIWLMHANQTTSERPVTEGTESVWIGAGATIVPRGTENEATYFTGQKYVWEDGGYFEGYRFDPPVRDGPFEYSVVSRITEPSGEVGAVDQIVAWQTFGGNPGDYITLPQGKTLWLPGTQLELWLGVRAVTTPNTFTANWDVKNDNGNPSPGEAWFQNNQTEIRVNDEDKLGSDQGNNLVAVQAGGTLQFAGQEWTITSVTDNGAFVTYGLTPLQGRPSEDERSLTFSWGSSDPLPVNSDATHWSGNAAVRGIEGVDLNNQTESDSQFPIDILLRELTVSDHWDFMSSSSLSAGGTGGGTSPGGSPTTTGALFPDNPAPGDLHYLTVEPVGLYIWYNNGSTSQWVQTNGGAGAGSGFLSTTSPDTARFFDWQGSGASIRMQTNAPISSASAWPPDGPNTPASSITGRLNHNDDYFRFYPYSTNVSHYVDGSYIRGYVSEVSAGGSRGIVWDWIDRGAGNTFNFVLASGGTYVGGGVAVNTYEVGIAGLPLNLKTGPMLDAAAETVAEYDAVDPDGQMTKITAKADLLKIIARLEERIAALEAVC